MYKFMHSMGIELMTLELLLPLLYFIFCSFSMKFA